jgi:hypothetical protein
LPSFYFCQVGLPNCWRSIFLVLPKLDGCQVDLANCWSCSERNKIMLMSFHLLKTYIKNPSPTTIRARIYARGEVSFAKFLFLPSWFAKLWKANFSYFAKIRWMPSWFAKRLKLNSMECMCAWNRSARKKPHSPR